MLSSLNNLTNKYREIRDKLKQDKLDLCMPSDRVIETWKNRDICGFYRAINDDVESLSISIDDYCIHLLDVSEFLLGMLHLLSTGFINKDIIADHLRELGYNLTLKELGYNLTLSIVDNLSHHENLPSSKVVKAWVDKDIDSFVKEIDNDLINLVVSVDDYCIYLLDISEFTDGLKHLMDVGAIDDPANIISVLLQHDYESSYADLITFHIRNKFSTFKDTLFNIESAVSCFI